MKKKRKQKKRRTDFEAVNSFYEKNYIFYLKKKKKSKLEKILDWLKNIYKKIKGVM